MAALGRILAETRTSRGLTLDDVERDTRIARRFLEALEHDEFDVLPAPVYCRAFLRTYSQYLGIDPKEVMQLYPAKGRETELAPLPQVTKTPPPAVSLNWLVAGGVAVLFLLAGLLLFRIGGGNGGTTPPASEGVSAQATTMHGGGAEQSGEPTIVPTQPASVQAEGVSVPDMRGALTLDALASVTDNGLTYVVVQVYDDKAPEGTVINQSPSPNSKAKAGDPVTLLISRGRR